MTRASEPEAGAPFGPDLVAGGGVPPPSVLARCALYYHTIRHLKPGQIASQLQRRLWPPRPPAQSPVVTLGVGVRCGAFLPARESPAPPGQLCFLRQSLPFDPLQPDWSAAQAPKLWRYNLHYFDFLSGTGFSPATKAGLLNAWIQGVPPGHGDGWEPYPLSLRSVNWLKYALTLPKGGFLPLWVDSLAHQMAALEGALEYHLLANHLLKNGKALVFAGVCLEGEAPARWLARGLQIVAAQTREQILPDGGHIERSPMYHCIVLEDLLDLLTVLAGQEGQEVQRVRLILADAARRALEFLRGLANGGQQIPLFNDSAWHIGPPLTSLLDYGARVLGLAPTSDPDSDPIGAPTLEGGRICFPQTGYYGYRQGGNSLIVDGGSVGPDYQPGHAHSDTLSYELVVGGDPVVGDSGTFDYEPGPLRHYLRSTAAHNTLRLDGAEQSEVWGQFRVARRAKPLSVLLSDWWQGELLFTGAHDGYRRLPGRPVHRREIRMRPEGPWIVRDTVTGGGVHRVESFLHLHPSVGVESLGPREFRLTTPGGSRLRLVFGALGTLRQATGCYCPEFGLRLARRVWILDYSGPLPVELSHTFERL